MSQHNRVEQSAICAQSLSLSALQVSTRDSEAESKNILNNASVHFRFEQQMCRPENVRFYGAARDMHSTPIKLWHRVDPRNGLKDQVFRKVKDSSLDLNFKLIVLNRVKVICFLK